MAEEMSSEYLKTIKFPRYVLLHCVIWLRGFVGIFRYLQRLTTPGLTWKVLSLSIQRLQRRLFSHKQVKQVSIGAKPVPQNPKELVTSALEGQREHYQTHRWAFVDGILDEAFHHQLISQWPKRKFLAPPKDMIKAYDIGFYWIRDNAREPDYIDEHPVLRELLEYLRSEPFGGRITRFSGGDKDLLCRSFLITTTYPGSNVPPHKDGGYHYQPEAKHSLNIVFFVNGTGGPDAGGLSLIRDNTFTDVIFEPYKLRNTALIYDELAPFFHGFRPVARGKFRWSANVLFCPKGYAKKKIL